MEKQRANLVVLLLVLVGLMGYSLMVRADEEQTKSPPVEITETLNAILQNQNQLLETQNALLRTQNALAAKLSDIKKTQDAMHETILKIWRRRSASSTYQHQ